MPGTIARLAALTSTLSVLAVLGPGSAVADALPRLDGDFMWGVAGSAFQTEGGGPPTQWDGYMASGKAAPIGRSVDFRHRYRGDIARAAELGANDFRFGISWARVEPEPGRFDLQELRYYDDVVRRIVAHGLRPVITLQHFAIPAWVLARNGGGFEQAATVQDWLAYVRAIVPRYSGLHALWLTFNEPEIDAVLEGKQRGANGVALIDDEIAAHRAAYDLIHANDPTATVAMTHYCICIRGSDGRAVDLADQTLDRIADKNDLIALDWYFRFDSPTDLLDVGVTTEPWQADIDPSGLLEALRTLHERFPAKPLFVSESGMPTQDGQPRPDGYRRCEQLADVVQQVQLAKAEGLPVIGYEYWSLTDNYEWGSFTPRYGLYTVDALTDPTLARRPTDAVSTYRSLVRRGGVPDDYLPAKTGQGFRPGHATSPCVSGGPAEETAPALTRASLIPRALRPMQQVRSSLSLYPPIAGPRGALLTFTLARPATVVMTLTRTGHGRLPGRIALRRPGGPARVVFTGRWRARRLAPGSYRLRLRPAPGRSSRTTSLPFTVASRHGAGRR